MLRVVLNCLTDGSILLSDSQAGRCAFVVRMQQGQVSSHRGQYSKQKRNSCPSPRPVCNYYLETCFRRNTADMHQAKRRENYTGAIQGIVLFPVGVVHVQ